MAGEDHDVPDPPELAQAPADEELEFVEVLARPRLGQRQGVQGHDGPPSVQRRLRDPVETRLHRGEFDRIPGPFPSRKAPADLAQPFPA